MSCPTERGRGLCLGKGRGSRSAGSACSPLLPSLHHTASSAVRQTNLLLNSNFKHENLVTFSSRVVVKSKPRGLISATVVILVYSMFSLSSVKCNSRGEDGQKAGGLRSFILKPNSGGGTEFGLFNIFIVFSVSVFQIQVHLPFFCHSQAITKTTS